MLLPCGQVCGKSRGKKLNQLNILKFDLSVYLRFLPYGQVYPAPAANNRSFKIVGIDL